MIVIKKMTLNKLTGETLWSGIQLSRLAPSRRHHFKRETLDTWQMRGFASMNETTITLHTVDGDMVFNIDHVPTRVCIHCGIALPNEDQDDPTIPQGDPRLGKAAREHVAKEHKGKKSPSPSHPNGYKYKKYYGVTADDAVLTVNPKARQISKIEKIGA